MVFYFALVSAALEIHGNLPIEKKIKHAAAEEANDGDREETQYYHSGKGR